MAILASLSWLGCQAIDLIFPRYCIGCGREGFFLCSPCGNSFPRLEEPLCKSCGRPVDYPGFCADCRKNSPAADEIRSPFVFDGLTRTAIYRFKYRNMRTLAQPLAELMAGYIGANALQSDVIVPVPLHKHKLKVRGYNQAELLARELGKLTGWAVAADVLVRLSDAVPQARTSRAEERYRNVKDAFACKDDSLRDKNILLIDDVCTTGATVNACAAVLKNLPAAAVRVLTVAREI
ncbi:MAG: ComF family protein [Dehalococcoidia bacterium]|nr:ComF family protein [Dehalococcoidia bacterium]